jgi:hypothetical protein
MRVSSALRGCIQSPGPLRRGRAWIWFFAVLVALTIAAITIQIWYNSRQQLTWEQLAQAQQLWKQKGPADYDLEYTIKKLDDTEEYQVRVRNGQAISATRNGQPMEERLYRYQDMTHMLGFVEEFWRQDHPEDEPGPRVFATATFDAEDGHLIHYVRSVTSKRERVEITIKSFRPISRSALSL